MEQLFNKALTLEKSKYVKLVKALIPYTETSLSYSEIMGLAFDVLLHSPTFEQTRMPLSEYQMRSPNIPSVGSVVYYDLHFAKDLLHAFFYEDITPEAYVEANGIAKDDWYGRITGNVTDNKPQENTSSQVTSSVQSQVSSNDTSSSESGNTSSLPSEITSSSEPPTTSDITSSGTSEPSVSSDIPSSSIPTDSSTPSSSLPSTPEVPPVSSEQGTTSENSST
jgi:hypothetical protein